MEFRLVRFEDLTDVDMADWHRLRESRDLYANPFFDPGFAGVVASIRDNVRVGIVRDAGEMVCAWPLHVSLDRFARPIGAPFSDHHGPLFKEGVQLQGRDLVRGLGLMGASFNGLMDVDQRFADVTFSRDGACIIDVSSGADAYFDWQRTTFPKHAKKMRRLRRKAEREIGELTFTFDDPDEAALEQVFEWKAAQYAETGRHNVLAPDWTRAMMKKLLRYKSAGLSGIFHTLRVGDRLVAGEFNIMSPSVIHAWIPAYDAEFASFTPGMILSDHIIREGADRGVRTLDFGVDAWHYKKYYTTYQLPLSEGTAWANAPVASMRFGLETMWRKVEAAPLGPPARLAGKIRRRFDLIRAVEPTMTGRLKGMACALRRPAPPSAPPPETGNA